jgi:hypothetical protein
VLILADDPNDIFPESEKTAYTTWRFESSEDKDQKNFLMVLTSVGTSIC